MEKPCITLGDEAPKTDRFSDVGVRPVSATLERTFAHIDSIVTFTIDYCEQHGGRTTGKLVCGFAQSVQEKRGPARWINRPSVG